MEMVQDGNNEYKTMAKMLQDGNEKYQNTSKMAQDGNNEYQNTVKKVQGSSEEQLKVIQIRWTRYAKGSVGFKTWDGDSEMRQTIKNVKIRCTLTQGEYGTVQSYENTVGISQVWEQ